MGDMTKQGFVDGILFFGLVEKMWGIYVFVGGKKLGLGVSKMRPEYVYKVLCGVKVVLGWYVVIEFWELGEEIIVWGFLVRFIFELVYYFDYFCL
jgi:hypothetical protein